MTHLSSFNLNNLPPGAEIIAKYGIKNRKIPEIMKNDKYEYITPPTTQIDDSWSVFHLLLERVQRDPSSLLIKAINPNTHQLELYTSEEVFDIVCEVGAGLLALGIRPGESVSIFSRTRVEWTILDLSIQAIGAVTVPIYETSSESQIQYIIKDARVKLILAENDRLASSAVAAANAVNEPVQVLEIDGGALGNLRNLGKEHGIASESGGLAKEIESIQASRNADDICTIVYTSGSTGTPKGVELTNRSLLAVTYDANAAVPEVISLKSNNLLLFLPLAHAFARVCQMAMIASSGVLSLSSDIKTLVDDLQLVKPTVILGVPRVFEKVYNAAWHKASGSGVSKLIFQRATRTAIEYAKEHERLMLEGRTPDQARRAIDKRLVAKHTLYKQLVYSKIMHVLGGEALHAVCGGAPLNTNIAYFFRGAGLDLLEGYGLTETAAPCFVNRPTKQRVGTIGPAFPGVNVAIVGDDGELALNTPYTFKQYHNNPDATAEVLITEDKLPNVIKRSPKVESGNNIWFLTGDLADIDQYGFVKITGRKKDIIVTAGGKNISPTVLETTIDSEKIVSNSVVVGDNRPFISALITLDMDELDKYCDRIGRPHFASLTEAANDSGVHVVISGIVEQANAKVSRAESIRKFKILDKVFDEHSGTLTPTMKIRRQGVNKVFANAIDEIYA